MEPLLYSLRAVLRGALILSLSLTVFAQIVAEPDASVFPSGRKAADFSLAVSQPALVPRPVFEFRGIRIDEEMKEAERTFLSLKVGKHLQQLRHRVEQQVRPTLQTRNQVLP